MPTLRDLLELRVAVPAGFDDAGESLLVLSNETGTMQLHRAGLDGALERLTDFAEPVGGQFVPGSGRVLLEMDEGGNERHQLYLLDARPGAAPEPLVVEPEFLHRTPRLTRDGRLLAYGCNRRNGVDFDVYVRDLASGEERTVFDLGGWCEPLGFSPDGRWLGVSRMSDRPADDDLYLVSVADGRLVHVTPHDDEAQFGAPAWLPDSEAFYFSASTGRDNAAIARYDVARGAWEYVLEDEWDLDCLVDEGGRWLLVCANADGYSRLELRDPGTLEPVREVPLPGRGVVANAHFSRDGRLLAFHYTSPLVAGDVWVHDTASGETDRLTRSSGAGAEDELVEPSLHRFRSFDGESVPVFLYEARAVEGPRPVVVMIHGGPEAQLRPIFSPLAQFFASAGYAVAAPNVRGSTGYGKRYEHLDDVEKRLDSVRDLVALHDWLRDSPERFDAERVVLYGGSYGGYMVLAGLAFHPERWAAGVEIVGISSLVTFLENTAEWRRAFREREYGSLERDREFLESVSPINHVARIRAPLFVIHGANDPRVPLGEARQIHAALTARGVRCEILVYDDEGHGLQKLKNRLDAYPRAVAFLDEVLGSPSGG
ncbi:MAG TPA: S9 family peptidase [Gaiellaceae bacterium]|nr:S9 family peptidase [Gaiellaceae bacterium]